MTDKAEAKKPQSTATAGKLVGELDNGVITITDKEAKDADPIIVPVSKAKGVAGLLATLGR